MLHRSGFGNSISTRVSFILVKSVIESDIRTHVQTIETCSITVLHGRDPWALFRKTFVVVIYRPVIYKPIFDHKFMHKKRRCRNFWLICHTLEIENIMKQAHGRQTVAVPVHF